MIICETHLHIGTASFFHRKIITTIRSWSKLKFDLPFFHILHKMARWLYASGLLVFQNGYLLYIVGQYPGKRTGKQTVVDRKSLLSAQYRAVHS